jgi:hypothetical protein
LNGPYADSVFLEESGILPEALAMDFDGDFDGTIKESTQQHHELGLPIRHNRGGFYRITLTALS